MTTIYKYCGVHGIKILKNLELKVTPPDQFNDPFEFTPRIICSSVNRTFKGLLTKDALKGMFERQKKAGFRGDFREFKRQVKRARSALVASMEPKMPAAIIERQATYLSQVSEDHGVLCMSEEPGSIVMWGHYCDKHQGMVIEFDRSWSIFQGIKGLHPVCYTRERVVWDTSWASDSPEERAYIERLVFSKNNEWAYEKEVRQIFALRGLKRTLLADGNIGYFLPIPPEIIASITLGARCSAKLEREVRTALRDPCLSHVKLRHALLHESDFALKFQ